MNIYSGYLHKPATCKITPGDLIMQIKDIFCTCKLDRARIPPVDGIFICWTWSQSPTESWATNGVNSWGLKPQVICSVPSSCAYIAVKVMVPEYSPSITIDPSTIMFLAQLITSTPSFSQIKSGCGVATAVHSSLYSSPPAKVLSCGWFTMLGGRRTSINSAKLHYM